MKNVEKNSMAKTEENKKKVFMDKKGAFLSMSEIHGKGLNFFGTNFRED